MSDRPALPPVFRTRPFAHRGLHGAGKGIAENSRAAFSAAITAGYGIELDLQLTADGEAVVFHDHDLGRLTGHRGAVSAHSASDLGQTKLLVGGEGIPALAEVLALVAGRAPLLIEIKDQDGALGPQVGPLEARVAELLANYRGDAAVMSFNPHSIARVSALAPNVPIGLTTCAFAPEHWPLVPKPRLQALPEMSVPGASFISHDHHDLTSPFVARARGQGLAVLCWTIRSPAEEAEARKYADNITFEGYAAPR